MQYCTRNPTIKKPELGDPASIIDINDNMDVIDGIICKSNFNGAVDPGTGDDIVDGYSVGSNWWNVTAHRLFIAESVATGAAVWRQVYPSKVPLVVFVRNSAGTTITGGGAITKIPFATKVMDEWDMWSNDTFTAKSAGEAFITGSILISTYSQTQGKRYHVYIYKNGNVSICAGTFLETGGTVLFGINIATMISVNAGDKLDVRVLRDGTGDQTLNTNVTYNWLKIVII